MIRGMLNVLMGLCLFGFGVSSAMALEVIEKTSCMAFSESNVPMNQQKKQLLLEAKRAAANQIFGELITSHSSVEDFELTNDLVTSSSVGMVRIQGNPVYRNGKSFGETCVTIRAFATKEDRNKFKPVYVYNKQCVSDATLTVRGIRQQAEDQVILAALSKYDRKLDMAGVPQRLALVHKVKYVESGFIPDTATYCAKFEGVLYPVEITSLLATIKKVAPKASAPVYPQATAVTIKGVQGRAIAPNNFYIARATPFSSDANVSSHARGCGIEIRLPKYIYKFTRKKAKITDSLAGRGNASILNLEVKEAIPRAGKGYWITVEGKLYNRGLLIGSFTATKGSKKGFLKTRCNAYSHSAQSLGKSIAAWSLAPTMNAVLK